MSKENPLPFIPSDTHLERIQQTVANKKLPNDAIGDFAKQVQRTKTGLIFLETNRGHGVDFVAENLHLSKCYHCDKIAVWVHTRLLFPPKKSGIPPNANLPEEVLPDFEEAREIVNASPRGAAALLRLCVQKLCKHLGEKGKNIDDDIAALVRKGLNPTVQKALDIVRVIGNEAVHPGVLDLKDDLDTATSLFGLINSIVDQMMSHPKVVDDLYGSCRLKSERP